MTKMLELSERNVLEARHRVNIQVNKIINDEL